MRTLNFLIKPASGLCNMRCQYCFYQDEVSQRQSPDLGVMSYETSELLISRAMEAVDKNGRISFAFQGGEPTVAGLEFFRHFVERVKAQNQKNAYVSYSIQTNGLSLDRQWAEFFQQEGFLVGISLDGDKSLHDEFRLDTTGKGTWNRVKSALDLLLKLQVEVNLLCVVTKRCAKSPERVYNSLKKTGVKYFQFIPCLDPLEVPRGTQPYSLTPNDYGSFLCTLFDLWFRDWQKGNYTSIRLFDDYVHLAMGLPASTCATSGSCGSYLVVESDGSVYPCDFYVLDTWKLGDLTSHTLEELSHSPQALRFLQDGWERPAPCSRCPWKSLCFGGCKRDWITEANGQKSNYFCSAFQTFFAYAAPRLNLMAKAEWAARRQFHRL